MSFDKSTLQLEASASVDADVCVGRCGCLRRSVRMSASVGADVCVGRCRTCLITLLASTNNNKNRKEQNFDIEVLLFSLVGCKWSTWLGHFKGVHLERHLQGGALVPSAPTKIMVHFYSADALLALTSGKTELETSAPPKNYSVGALETSAPPEVALNSEKFTLP